MESENYQERVLQALSLPLARLLPRIIEKHRCLKSLELIFAAAVKKP